MVVKGQSGQQKKPASATSDQLRFAQLTLEGRSTEDDTANIQKLIKKVIETTRCSPSQAELALYDHDNNLMAAVDWILDQGMQVESWTEQKSKKEKKKEEEERKPTSRGLPSSRGRGGGVADRGGRGSGRGGSTSAGPRSSAPRGNAPSGRGGRGGQSNVKPQTSRSQTEASPPKPAENDLTEEAADWKSGPMEFKRSETVATSAPSSSSAPLPPSSSGSSAPTAPISFAAVAAAAARREQMKNQPPPPVVSQPAPEPVRAPSPVKEFPIEEPETSECLPAEESFVSEPSVSVVNPTEEHENELVPEDEPVSVMSVHNVQAASPQLQANVTWTTQLKSDLGIGVPISTEVSPVKPSQQYIASAPLPGVEFVTDAVSSGLTDYSFGFVDVPPAPAPIPAAPAPSAEQVPQPTDNLFANTRQSAATVAPLKQPSEIVHSNVNNGDYSMRNSTPPPSASSLSQTNARSLGFGDASTVSYTPSERQPMGKPLGHLQQPHQPPSSQQQQHQAQSHQPQMFPPQLPYSSFPPYMGMYSPVTNVRPDDYAALMGQYPFGGMNMDLSSLNTFMATSGLAQQSSNNQNLSNQHRSDSHGMDSVKFPSQSNRDQNQPSAVQPPPGFGAGASPFMTQPLSNLVMQQHYPPQHPGGYSFYMPNVQNPGRQQMYPQDEDRKSYDKMGGKAAHATPPPQFHHNAYIGGGNNKKYQWNA